MSTPLLEVDELAIEYGQDLRAVDGASLSIGRGELVGLVGESGSGKSTVARAAIRLLPANARIVGGAVRLGGRDLLPLSERTMREIRGAEIGMVFQDPLTSLNPVIPIGVQIGEGYRRKTRGAARRRRVLEVMELVGLPDPASLVEAYPHELSGGLRQRVAIAGALVSEPRLLLADEPTTALDVTIQDQILKLLTDLCSRLGMSVLLVTHDLGVVAQTCHQVAVMYAGRIVETGPVEQLFESPGHPYTQALIDSIPRGPVSDARLQPIPGAPPHLGDLPPGCRFAPRCRHAQEPCHSTDPPLEQVRPDQQAACLRSNELLELTNV